MSGAKTYSYVLTAEELAARVLEQRRQGLCAEVDGLSAQARRLADRARRAARAYGAPLTVDVALGTVDRTDVEALAEFIARSGRALARAEADFDRRCTALRRTEVMASIASLPAVAPPSVAPQLGGVPQPADVTRDSDLAAAADTLAALDGRIEDTAFLDDVVGAIGRAASGRRVLLLDHLAAEVQARNEALAHRDRITAALEALTARAAVPAEPAAVRAAARAVAAHDRGEEVDVSRVAEAVLHAELRHEQRERNELVRRRAIQRLGALGYHVVPAADVFTARGGTILRGGAGGDYGIGLDVTDDRLTFTTARLVAPGTPPEEVSSADEAVRDAVCRDIGEVCANLGPLGIDVDLLGVSAVDDVVVTSAAPAPKATRARRRRSTMPAPLSRAARLPDTVDGDGSTR